MSELSPDHDVDGPDVPDAPEPTGLATWQRVVGVVVVLLLVVLVVLFLVGGEGHRPDRHAPRPLHMDQ